MVLNLDPAIFHTLLPVSVNSGVFIHTAVREHSVLPSCLAPAASIPGQLPTTVAAEPREAGDREMEFTLTGWERKEVRPGSRVVS